MISSTNFNSTIHILDKLTANTPLQETLIRFDEEYQGQQNFSIALNILNKAVIHGTDQQKAELLNKRHKIILLNEFLKKDNEKQIRQPKTKFEKMVETATSVPRVFFTLLLDLFLLPGALGLLIAASCKTNFNPKQGNIKLGKTPILLLHGSGFNESEWLIGRQFLKKEQYGSIFSLNYDGLVSNDAKLGIDDYAQNKISQEIKKIKETTGCHEVILIGHSMGGLIAGYYAENLAALDEINVKHIISIASPWQGTPTLDFARKLKEKFKGQTTLENEAKRYQQMSLRGGTQSDPNFRQNLVIKALNSEKAGDRKYYNIWSSTDYAVPCNHGSLTEDRRRQRVFNYLGHYALVVWPSVWLQVRTWLDDIKTPSSTQL